MMTSDLRDELTRLGDDAPRVQLDPDLWRRGRRARRRARIATGVAVVALLASVGGAAATLTDDQGRAAPASPGETVTEEGGVPGTVHLPPDHLVVTDDSGAARWDDRIAESDLAVGRGAVAFTAGTHQHPDGDMVPMVVTTDGRHHALDLPGWQSRSELTSVASRPLALSPDGSSLAYAWRGHTEGVAEPLGGLAVLDLLDGDLRTITSGEGESFEAVAIVWSPDSRWLAWAGATGFMSSADGTSSSFDLAAGRVAPGADTTEQLPWSFEALTIDSEGVVTRTSERNTRTWDGRPRGNQRRYERVAEPHTPAVTSPDGSSVLLGSSQLLQSALFLDPATGDVAERELGKDLGLYPEGAEVYALGWVDDTLAVALVMPGGDVTLPDDAQLVLMSAPSVPEDSWTYRIVGHLDTSKVRIFAPGSVSVAVDLMTLDRPTVAVSAPDWPVSERRVAVALGLVLLGAVLAAYLLVVWRRRRV